MIPESLVWVLAATLLGLVVTMYLSWTAGRVDRMHARVEAARATLDAQRHRRSGIALEIAVSGLLDPASAVLVADSAHRARAAAPGDEELAENDLTRALGATFDDPAEVATMHEYGPPGSSDAAADGAAGPTDGSDAAGTLAPEDRASSDEGGQDLLAELDEAIRRLQLARRFHNDAVRATRALRGHRVVRWLRLAGHAPMPRPIDFDDSSPPGLRG